MIPFLGTSSTQQLTKGSFKKSHAFDFRNGVPVFEVDKPGIGGQLLPGQKPKIKAPVFSEDEVSSSSSKGGPSWISNDNKVLRFFGYFKEPVFESAEEQYRIRNCTIYVYLANNTIHVAEPHVENSGIPQGQFIKRQEIPKSMDDKDDIYTFMDFNLGIEVEFFGRTIRIADCDQATRVFYEDQLGIELNESEEVPEDVYTKKRVEIKQSMLPTSTSKTDYDSLKKFLENDRQVLRFFCTWDDRNSAYGDYRQFVIHFYTADDTVEVLEVIGANSGREPFPQFLKRQKIPKKFSTLSDLGSTDYYTEEDFAVGTTVTLFGRDFNIHDCDSNTRKFYKENFGVEFGTLEIEEEEEEVVDFVVPPYNGFGSEADSLRSAMSLVPKIPKKNFAKMIENDGKIIRFRCKMDTDNVVDQEREFVVSYYLADDTIGVYEPPLRNSGIGGGNFLKRQAIMNPDTGDFFKAEDLYLGASVEIHKRRFILEVADEYALNYMECNPEQFEKSDLFVIETKLRDAFENVDAEAVFAHYDVDGNNCLNSEEFNDLLSTHFDLTPQEIVTLMRRYDLNEDGSINMAEFLRAVKPHTFVQVVE
eukprot:TRINITY_DN670_c0_g1_i5.p1 TRINITY_DN670_c0_g1~~TRINITY_DN670_c0_g1_i5.p1  ORF type:complete len:589 (+),score=225.67 TRINITY_DN670_c0_g1_i5:124-1890(+)